MEVAMKTKWLICLVLVLLPTSAVVVLTILIPRDSVTRDTLKTIRHGMNEEEVILLLKRPADRATFGLEVWDEQTRWFATSDNYLKEWIGEAGHISIVFNRRGVVISAQYAPRVRTEPRPTILDS